MNAAPKSAITLMSLQNLFYALKCLGLAHFGLKHNHYSQVIDAVLIPVTIAVVYIKHMSLVKEKKEQ